MITFRVEEYIQSLSYFKPLFKQSKELELLKELDIEPYTKWSLAFGCTYWHLKYLLLKDGKVNITDEELEEDYLDFIKEDSLNIIWLCILDKENYEIKFIDGECHVSIFNKELISILEIYGDKWQRVN